MNSFHKYLDELYFYMQEFYNFETKFISNLSQDYIFGDIACLVDANEIDKWKENVEYDQCLEFLENYDRINFDKKQIELFKENAIKNKINLKSFETLDEVCHSLKRNNRISIISRQFFCYLNKITYSPTVFNYYTKNNQLIIYFGTGKSLFIPYYVPNKKLDSENIYIIDLPENKHIFIDSIFKNQNMSDTLLGDKSISLSMYNLLNYTVNKNGMKKKKTYNFYSNEEDDVININPSISNKNNMNINYSNNINNNIDNNIDNNMNINVNYSNNVDINYSNNKNIPDISNNINIYNYEKIIETNKPFIKDSNNNNKEEEYPYNQYIENNSQNENYNDEEKKNEIEKSQENNKDNFINNNKSDEYKIEKSYKDKEIEYDEILKEKNNIENNKNENINNIENTFKNNENDIKNTMNVYNINNIPNEIIEKKEIQIKQEIINPELNNDNKNINDINTIINININNNNNINIEDEKENQKKEEINYEKEKNEKENNLKSNLYKEDIKEIKETDVFKPELEIKEKEKKEIISNTPNGDNINDINIMDKKDNIDNIQLNNKSDFKEDKKDNFEIVGLYNINGKSSYINTVIQCLSNTIPLTNYFLDDKNRNRILQNNLSLNNPDGPQLSPSYLELIEKLWINEEQIKSVDPFEFINNIQSLNMNFEKEEEKDVGDLAIFILEQLDLELNEKKLENSENNTELNSNDKNIIKNNFYKDLLSNNSIIYDTFFGGVCEIVQECKKCKEECDLKKLENKKIYEYRNLNYFMFPVSEVFKLAQKNNAKEYINIYDCLNFFQSPDILDGENGKKCEKCGKLSTFLLTAQINTCQNNLLIILNRDFKKDKNIKFKFDESLDMTEYVIEKKGKLIYNLYGIIFLSKNEEIHYVAFCKIASANIWYKCDDNVVEPVKNLENDMYNFAIPVALFYQKELNFEEYEK